MLFIAVKEGMVPVPVGANPTLGLSIDQSNTHDVVGVRSTAAVAEPFATVCTWFCALDINGRIKIKNKAHIKNSSVFM